MIPRWSLSAERQFLQAVENIAGFSRKSADKFIITTLEKVTAALASPGRFPLDSQRDNNDGNFRFFLVGSYRFSYRVTAKEIVILRCRHIKQAPLPY